MLTSHHLAGGNIEHCSEMEGGGISQISTVQSMPGNCPLSLV